MAPADLKFQYFNVSMPVDYVAVVEVDRPKKLNAYTIQMFVDLGEIFKNLSVDPDVRCIVLTASGERAFTVCEGYRSICGEEQTTVCIKTCCST